MEWFVAVTFRRNVLPSVNFLRWKTILKGCKKMSMLMKSTGQGMCNWRFIGYVLILEHDPGGLTLFFGGV